MRTAFFGHAEEVLGVDPLPCPKRCQTFEKQKNQRHALSTKTEPDSRGFAKGSSMLALAITAMPGVSRSWHTTGDEGHRLFRDTDLQVIGLPAVFEHRAP